MPSISIQPQKHIYPGEKIHTTHFLQLGLVKLITRPLIPLNLLRIRLPLSQKAHLVRRNGVSHSLRIKKDSKHQTEDTYQMDRVVDVAVRSELGLDVFIAQDAHLGWEVLPMGAEYATVEG